jgi:hypothetical protein
MHIPTLVCCVADTAIVSTCIRTLSSTTFVVVVAAPALVVLVPLFRRALSNCSIAFQRRAVIVIDNLVKLARAGCRRALPGRAHRLHAAHRRQRRLPRAPRPCLSRAPDAR